MDGYESHKVEYLLRRVKKGEYYSRDHTAILNELLTLSGVGLPEVPDVEPSLPLPPPGPPPGEAVPGPAADNPAGAEAGGEEAAVGRVLGEQEPDLVGDP